MHDGVIAVPVFWIKRFPLGGRVCSGEIKWDVIFTFSMHWHYSASQLSQKLKGMNHFFLHHFSL